MHIYAHMDTYRNMTHTHKHKNLNLSAGADSQYRGRATAIMTVSRTLPPVPVLVHAKLTLVHV